MEEAKKEKRCEIDCFGYGSQSRSFPKNTQILEGNTANSASLPNMIDTLRLKTENLTAKALVVSDVGIATVENLKLIQEKGYDYVC